MATNPEAQTRYTRQRKALHLTPAERAAVGKAARAQVPRSSQAVFAPAENRPDPVALLEAQAATRVPELAPIRYGRMLVSPFTFDRGAALIMASDLAATPTSDRAPGTPARSGVGSAWIADIVEHMYG